MVLVKLKLKQDEKQSEHEDVLYVRWDMIYVFISSPELKAQVSFSDLPLSVCLFNFYIFDFFSRTARPILKLAQITPRQKEFRIVQIKVNPLSARRDTSKKSKNTLIFSLNLLS
jgi:hypothetical protein